MLKVVINKCYGGFGLSNKAVEECVKKGMTLTKTKENGRLKDSSADFFELKDSFCGQKYGEVYRRRLFYKNKFRCNPVLVDVVKELGEEANGPFSKLKIVEIPFADHKGWHIDEYDGMEKINENHNSWG